MSLLSAFNRQCQRAPDNIAFIEGDRQFSYRQVEQRANQLSSFLTKRKNPNRRIVIALDRGIDAAIAILAVLGAGACYIPLDIKNPVNRLNYIINDAVPQCIIGKGRCPDWLETPHSGWILSRQLLRNKAQAGRQKSAPKRWPQYSILPAPPAHPKALL